MSAMRLSRIALLCAVLPLLTVALCWWLSWQNGRIADCNPLLDGCTTISATGREGIAYFLFKLGMLPQAVLLLIFWTLSRRALWHASRRANRGASKGERRADTFLWLLGVLSALMLVLYTSYLGSENPAFAIYRRIGASLHFACALLAQMLFLMRLSGLKLARKPYYLIGLSVVGQWCLGLASLPFTLWTEDPLKDQAENIIEWWFALFMQLFYLAQAFLWRDDNARHGPGHSARTGTA